MARVTGGEFGKHEHESRHHGRAEDVCYALDGPLNVRVQTMGVGSLAVGAVCYWSFRRTEAAMRVGVHPVDSTRRGVPGNRLTVWQGART